MIKVTLRPARVYVFGRRIHHGLVGLVLLLSDVHDWRVWVRDLVRHPAWVEGERRRTGRR